MEGKNAEENGEKVAQRRREKKGKKRNEGTDFKKKEREDSESHSSPSSSLSCLHPSFNCGAVPRKEVAGSIDSLLSTVEEVGKLRDRKEGKKEEMRKAIGESTTDERSAEGYEGKKREGGETQIDLPCGA